MESAAVPEAPAAQKRPPAPDKPARTIAKEARRAPQERITEPKAPRPRPGAIKARQRPGNRAAAGPETAAEAKARQLSKDRQTRDMPITDKQPTKKPTISQ